FEKIWVRLSVIRSCFVGKRIARGESMFFQKIRAIFEWFAQKRAAKDREVLNYQWTTYRSNKDDVEEPAQTSSHSQQTPAKQRQRPVGKSATQKVVAPDDFTATVSSDTSRIEPQVEIDVDALFDETKAETTPKTKPRVAKPKTTKTPRVKKTPAKVAETAKTQEIKTEVKDVEATSAPVAEEKPAGKKRATPAKPRVRKTVAKKPVAAVEEKPAPAMLESDEKAAEVPKKTRVRKVTKSAESSASEVAAAKPKTTRTTKSKTAKAAPVQTPAADYRDIVRVNTLKGLQALLQDSHPEVTAFRKKFDMSAYLRDKPEVVEELKAKLAKTKA
ncbi:MAG: hypothetical protein Q4E62_09610, partial [Sutterellaceae bacterium]|nr:hypothetical protein [Sutterellaceae bacterium]